MKRILIRAGISPLENYSASEMLLSDNRIMDFGNNAIGNNNGNMLYAFSVIRTIMKDEDWIIDADHYKYEAYIATDEEIEYVNSTYDMYVLPLANAFRHKYRFALSRLTDFIRRINIPVVVIGIGVGNPKDVEANQETIKAFIKAALDKSAIIGVRGNDTVKVLSKIGCIEGKEITAIGCPSAYTFGPTIKVREPKYGRFSKIVFNDNVRSKNQVHNFLYSTMTKYRNAWYMPQMLEELRELYVGIPTDSVNDPPEIFPSNIYHPYFKRGKSKFFLNIPTWLDFMSDAGISIGPRMHGNVIPVLAGTPSLFIAIDSRMQDMVKYHHYPYVLQKDIDSNTTLESLVEKMDYSEFYKHQQANFDHYLDFLKMNSVPSIYDGGVVPKRGEAPFDKLIQKIDFHEGVTPINKCSKKEMTARLTSFFPEENAVIRDLRKEARDMKRKEIQRMNEQ